MHALAGQYGGSALTVSPASLATVAERTQDAEDEESEGGGFGNRRKLDLRPTCKETIGSNPHG